MKSLLKLMYQGQEWMDADHIPQAKTQAQTFVYLSIDIVSKSL